MKPINIIVLIISILVVLTLLCIILFKYHNEKINNILKRLEKSESEYEEKLKNKYDIFIRMINIIENSDYFIFMNKTENLVNDINILNDVTYEISLICYQSTFSRIVVINFIYN